MFLTAAVTLDRLAEIDGNEEEEPLGIGFLYNL
jgi:hypothetical protein